MREPSADWADTCADTPNWRDNPSALDRLCEYGAMQLDDPIDPRLHDLRGQGLTAMQLHTITDIEPQGNYL
ncbi:hypothetical protein OG601_47140 [Streptomyces sp. NBC_01239]|uniref:hypothetical protein n=1 Tax=Streptomyces sp. NBC_01239 TaxID=2903792 RepID=UPI00225AAE32|nr:hypothetical protein [Streptomyces sp. NBC_01239]MCX4809031.1 hypothetical protein [Streptomyces sp. NBC_01239]MCX4818151.1 hypothetical protein [Streptomyces sp. NBC_01239]